jgi:hypothetical protein
LTRRAAPFVLGPGLIPLARRCMPACGVSPKTFGSGKQLFPGLTATGINAVRGAPLRVETERKRGGSESEGARKTEANREREREV